MTRPLAGNLNLTDSLALASAHGARVEARRGTGEVRVTFPGLPRPMLLNSRRKDSPLALIVQLRRLVANAVPR